MNPAIGGVVVFRMAGPVPVAWRRPARRLAGLRRPAVALTAAAGLWGAAVSGTKYALGGFDPLTLLSIELLAGAFVLWAALLLRGYRPPGSWWLPALLARCPGPALTVPRGASRPGNTAVPPVLHVDANAYTYGTEGCPSCSSGSSQ
jgi:hypothetical protein